MYCIVCIWQSFCRKSGRICRETYLPQRDDACVSRDKVIQSDDVSGPRRRREAVREDRQRQLARMATVKRWCTNSEEAADKVHGLQPRLLSLRFAYIFSNIFFSHPHISPFLSHSFRSDSPLYWRCFTKRVTCKWPNSVCRMFQNNFDIFSRII